MVGNIMFQLQTPRLLLKELTVADGEALFLYRSSPEVTQYQGWAPASVEDALRFIEEDICHMMNQPDTWFQFGIFLKENQNMIGDLGIHFLPDQVEIGVTVSPEYQRQGYAAEAVSRVLEFLFDTLHKDRVMTSVDPKNHRSMALMKRLGFQLEGINKKAVLFRGEWTDDAIFAMNKARWQTMSKID